MKILQNNMTTPIKCICSDCGSLFEFDYKDIQRREEPSFGVLFGSTTSKRFVVCPVCAFENSYDKVKVDSAKMAMHECNEAYEKYQTEIPNWGSNDSEKEGK